MSKPIRIAILADGRQAKQEMQSVGKETTALGKVGRLSGAVLKKGLMAGAVGATALSGTALFKGFGRLKGIEQAEAKLAGLGHSTARVDKIMNNALNSVKGTAFGLDQAATVAASAVAAGVKPGKALERTLGLVGDAATIAGVDMGEMGAIFNKVAASDGIQGEEIAQLGDRGIPILQLLAKELGVTAKEAKKMASEGKIDFATFQNAMEKGMGGAALKSGKTFSGSMDNAKAALGRLGAAVLEPTFKRLPGALGAVTDQIDNTGPHAEKAGKIIGKGLDSAVTQVSKSAKDMFKGGVLEGQSKKLDTLRSTGERLLSGTKKLAGGVGELLASFKPAAIETFNTALDGTVKVVDASGKVFEATAGATGSVASGLASVPGPIKEIALQAGIAALVMPRLASAAATVGSKLDLAQTSVRVMALEMRDGTARSAMFSRGLAQMGAQAQNVAGVGGMVLLAQSSQIANRELRALADVGGGALLGFALGGPIGAAIGAGAGLLKTTLSGGADEAASRIENLGLKTGDLVSTMDDLTGATTRATRGMVLTSLQGVDGLLKKTRELGLTDRQVVDGIMGQKAARETLAAALDTERTALEKKAAVQAAELETLRKNRQDTGIGGGDTSELDDAIKLAKAKEEETLSRLDNMKAIEAELGTVEAAKLKKQEEIRATLELGGAIKNLPKAARFDLKANGITAATGELARFAAKHKLTPKQINYLVKTVDAGASEAKIERVRKKAQELRNIKVGIPGLQAGVDAGIRGAEAAAGRGGKRVSDKLRNSTRGAKPNMQPFLSGLGSGIGAAAGVASGGAIGIGGQLSAGVGAGVLANKAYASNAVRTMVNDAIAAGIAAAEIRSPSRKTKRIGRFMAEGLAVGIRDLAGKPVKVMRGLVNSVIKAGQGGSASGIRSSVISAIDAQNKKSMKSFDARAKKEKARFTERQKREKKDFYARHKGEKGAKARDAFDRKQEKEKAKRERNAAKSRRLTEKGLRKAKKEALKDTAKERSALASNRKAHASIVEKLDDARDSYKGLVEDRESYRASIKNSFVELGNVANFDEGHMNSPKSMIEQLRERVKISERFTSAIAKLRGMSLNNTSLQQLLDKGPEAGLAGAEALAAGGAGMIKEVNTLTGQLATAGDTLGKSAAGQFHDAGIAAAQGLINGLASKEAALEKEGERLGKAINRGIKRELKIKSPSKVTTKDGVNAAMGLVVGLGRTEAKVYRAGVEVAKMLQGGVSSRRLVAPVDPRDVYATSQSLQPTGPAPIQITLTAEQLSTLEHGRKIQMSLDAYERAGGRRRAQ